LAEKGFDTDTSMEALTGADEVVSVKLSRPVNVVITRREMKNKID